MTNTRENSGQLRPTHPTARALPFDFIDYDTDNKANALALQDAVFGETTDPAAIGGATAKIFSRLKGIHQNLEAQTGSLQNAGTFQNKTVLSTFSSGGTPPNSLDIVATVDLANSPGSDWILVTMSDGGLGNSIGIGLSVSLDGLVWNDLYNTGAFSVLIYDANGGNNSGVSLSITENQPLWIRSPYRFIRFVDLGSGVNYDLAVYSATDIPFDNEASQNNILNAINNAVSLASDEDRLYRALVTLPGVNPGDILRRSSRSFYTQPGNPSFVFWTNETTGANISAPALASLVPITVAQNGQNVSRLVNSNASTLQVKLSNALIRSIYVDNLQAGIIYLGIHTGLSAAPTAGAIPLESYRVPSNGSTSIELDRVYSNGQVWLSFSSTPGALTLSANTKNVIVRFN